MLRIMLALLLVVIQTIPAYSASFDCKKAATAVEKMICSDENLSKLDEELAKVYAQALAAVPDRETLKKEQRDWVKKDRNKCRDIQCLRNSYANRTNKLQQLARLSITADSTASDKVIWGDWESFGTAFYNSGIISINSGLLKHEACKTAFKLISNKDREYLFEAMDKKSCYAFSVRHSLNYIKVRYENSNEITVRYYESMREESLQGDGIYQKVEH